MTVPSDLPSENAHASESGYRALNPWAVVSAVLGVLSVSTALHSFFLLVPLAGILTGWLGLRQLRRNIETQMGAASARAGIAASVVFGLGGTLFLQCVMSDVPYGYKEISFADLKPNPGERVPQYALDLQPTMRLDKKVFIRGHIYPGRQTQGIKEFILVPTISHCAFCTPQMLPTDMIQVKLGGDLTVDFKTTRIGVGGRLHVDPLSAQTPYALEADYVR